MSLSTETFKQSPYPEQAGDRFWRSGTGTVTITNSDTLLTTGTFVSKKFPMTTQNQYGFQVGYNSLIFYGEVIANVNEAAFCDSIQVCLIGYNAAGDSGFWVTDTVKFDTTQLRYGGGTFSTAGSRQFFMVELDIEDWKNVNVPPYDAAILIKSIESTSTDTLLLEDCGVIRRLTN